MIHVTRWSTSIFMGAVLASSLPAPTCSGQPDDRREHPVDGDGLEDDDFAEEDASQE